MGIQKKRLEKALQEQRSWSLSEFEQFICKHPLVSRLCQNLIWAVWNGGDAYTQTFIHSDHRFLDANGDELFLPEDTQIVLAHPVYFQAGLSQWKTHLKKQKTALEQLSRSVYFPAPVEWLAPQLSRHCAHTIETKKIRALLSGRWQATTDADGEIEARLNAELKAHMSLEIHPWALSEHDETRIYAVVVYRPGSWEPVPPRCLSAHVFSELVRDLESLASTKKV